MDVLLTVIFGLLGLAIGSFLNVCIDRLPAVKSLIKPASACDSCGKGLSPLDLIPVLSYLLLRGRCRYCGARIPKRVLWVELGTGLLLAFLYWRFGLTADFALTAVYSIIFIVIGVIDLERQLILNKIVYPAIVLALVLDAILKRPDIVSGVIGGAVGFTFLLLVALVSRGGMGFGDVKMAAFIGLVTGLKLSPFRPMVVVAILLGIIGGAVAAVLLLMLKIKKRKEAMPFGPFLSLGTIVTLIWGNQILDWYLDLFSG
jgi:leader peptidase (prepilin peptidase) / N-methyltransferase